MLPDFWQPFDDLGELLETLFGALFAAVGRPHLGFDGLLLEVPAQESFDGFDVVGTEYPLEVVVELEICCGAAVGRLTHRSDDVRTAGDDEGGWNEEFQDSWSDDIKLIKQILRTCSIGGDDDGAATVRATILTNITYICILCFEVETHLSIN